MSGAGETETLVCSRCFNEAPPAGSDDLASWGGSRLETVELAPSAPGLLLCPACREESPSDEELGGG